jgi:hypothetical protein
MAGWLLRAIVVENVAARVDGRLLDLPAAPHFRLEKEIKNVVTVIAKTCHYWMDHTSAVRQVAIGQLFDDMDRDTPLIEPLASSDGRLSAEDQTKFTRLAETLGRETGLPRSSHQYTGWIGVDCPSVHAAIWMMRALVVSNVLSRREGTVLFVPFNPARDPNGDRVVDTLVRTRRLAAQKGVL